MIKLFEIYLDGNCKHNYKVHVNITMCYFTSYGIAKPVVSFCLKSFSKSVHAIVAGVICYIELSGAQVLGAQKIGGGVDELNGG